MNNPKSKFVPRSGEDHRRRTVALMRAHQRFLRRLSRELGVCEFGGRRCSGLGDSQPPAQRFRRRSYSSEKASEALRKIIQMNTTPDPFPYIAAGLEINRSCSCVHEREARTERCRLVSPLAQQSKVVFPLRNNPKALAPSWTTVQKRKALMRFQPFRAKQAAY
jgi:hypothetical protein